MVCDHLKEAGSWGGEMWQWMHILRFASVPHLGNCSLAYWCRLSRWWDDKMATGNNCWLCLFHSNHTYSLNVNFAPGNGDPTVDMTGRVPVFMMLIVFRKKQEASRYMNKSKHKCVLKEQNGRVSPGGNSLKRMASEDLSDKMAFELTRKFIHLENRWKDKQIEKKDNKTNQKGRERERERERGRERERKRQNKKQTLDYGEQTDSYQRGMGKIRDGD